MSEYPPVHLSLKMGVKKEREAVCRRGIEAVPCMVTMRLVLSKLFRSLRSGIANASNGEMVRPPGEPEAEPFGETWPMTYSPLTHPVPMHFRLGKKNIRGISIYAIS